MSHGPLVCIIFFVGALHAADKPNRDILELQREVAQLGTVLDNLQKAFDARFTSLAAQIQTIGESAAGLQKGLAQISQDQDRKIVPLVAEQGTRLEQANGALTTMQQAVGDLTTAINRLADPGDRPRQCGEGDPIAAGGAETKRRGAPEERADR